MNVVITAGGRVEETYADLAGSAIKALAPIRGVTMLERTIDAARALDANGIAVVGGAHVRSRCAHRVERFVQEADSGSENVLRALAAWDDEQPVLYLTSDMPYVSGAALRDFVARAPVGALAMPLTDHRAFVQRFPNAPAFGITLAGERVINGGAFLFPSGSQPRIAAMAAALFAARKRPWRMAMLLGPIFLANFALGRLSVSALERKAERVLGFPAAAVRFAAPELAYDADTVGEYRYACDHA